MGELAGPPETTDRPIQLPGHGSPLLYLLLEANEVVHGGLKEQRVKAALIDQPLDDLCFGLKRASLPVAGQLTQNHHLLAQTASATRAASAPFPTCAFRDLRGKRPRGGGA